MARRSALFDDQTIAEGLERFDGLLPPLKRKLFVALVEYAYALGVKAGVADLKESIAEVFNA